MLGRSQMDPQSSTGSSPTATPDVQSEEWQTGSVEPTSTCGAGSGTPPPPSEEMTGVVVRSDKAAAETTLRVVVDILSEERKARMRLYNQMARGELPPSRPSDTPT